MGWFEIVGYAYITGMAFWLAGLALGPLADGVVYSAMIVCGGVMTMFAIIGLCGGE